MTKQLEENRTRAALAEARAGRYADVEDVEFREVAPATPSAPDTGAAPESAPPAAPEKPRRRIGLHHIAFFRAYLEGLDLLEQAERYLNTDAEARRYRNVLRWLVDELVSAARKRSDFGAARLLRVRPERIRSAPEASATPAPTRRPTLEEFAEANDPDGFYTEKELLELFAREFPATGSGQGEPDAAAIRRQARNERLRQRQMAALGELERLLVEDPKTEHHVTGWFDTSVALKLADVGLHTMGHLLDAVNAAGYRWYRLVPGLGERTAQRIVTFLDASARALGKAVSPAALERPSAYPVARARAQRQPSAAMGPFEVYVPAPSLDGSRGENRAPASRNKTGAMNDREAIDFWLQKYTLKPATARKYRGEAERLLLWANFQKNKPLSSLTILDCHEYINVFLDNPQPREMWVMETPRERSDPLWRPFRGKLGYKSRSDSLKALKSLCGALHDARYLDFNPFSQVRLATLAVEGATGAAARQTSTAHVQVERSLTDDEWQFVKRYLQTLPADSPATQRIRFVLRFAYGTGLRRSELAAARTGDVTRKFAGTELGTITVLNVVGKGDVLRQIPLSARLLEVLGDYLAWRGHHRDPAKCPADTPLIPGLEDNREKAARKAAEAASRVEVLGGEGSGKPAPRERPVTPPRLYEAVKRFFANAAAAASLESPELAANFTRASTHWLRHTFGSHSIAKGMTLETARNLLGHASLATTSIYATAELSRQYREVDAFLEDAF
ncbi:phage integrase family protein [Paraburkholderia youngii]|uniref:phage integrase family protein n=1 Tax=Paraburkholderia youngii TaxID=2782701 RepID=UPI003D205931